MITTKTNIDYEEAIQYSVVVHATDQGVSPSNGVFTLTLNVNNLNDIAPVCPSSQYDVTITETQVHSVVLTTIGCTDEDGDTLTYTITGIYYIERDICVCRCVCRCVCI